MIYSEKQYRLSSEQLHSLRDALSLTEAKQESPTWLKEMEISAIKGQIATLEAEISQYDLLKSGSVTFSKAHSLESLPAILVQARIASGMSQTELATSLGMSAQQIQRYEASEYSGASLSKLGEISKALNVFVTGIYENDESGSGAIYSWHDVDDVVWKQLPAREMARRKWFDVPNQADVFALAKDYFLTSAGAQFASALHRKKMHGSSMPNEYALLAWQARILEKASKVVESSSPPDFIADDRWIAELVSLTKRKDGPRKAQALLLSKGIILVVERHLQGTYLDGAAMLDRDGRPVVGLTIRHDRLDNFWFVLFHELGHVFLHLIDGVRYDFFDEEGSVESDTLESEADEFALEQLIPSVAWDECLSRFALSVESVLIDAEKLGIDASIIAGRIRKERGDYKILNSLIGLGEVASQFEENDGDLV